MSEIRRNKRVAKLMPGFDVSGNLIAYELQNTAITGIAGSGVETLVNSILTHLITFTSPEDVAVEVYPASANHPLVNVHRRIPHFQNQEYNYVDMKSLYHRLQKILTGVYLTKYSNTDLSYYIETYHIKDHIIFIELSKIRYEGLYDDEIEKFKTLLRTLALATRETRIHLVFYGDAVEMEPEVLEGCNLRMITRHHSSEISNIFIGCDMACHDTLKYGQVYVAEKNKPFVVSRLQVKFYPDTYLNKISKVNSSSKEPTCDYYTELYTLGKGLTNLKLLTAVKNLHKSTFNEGIDLSGGFVKEDLIHLLTCEIYDAENVHTSKENF